MFNSLYSRLAFVLLGLFALVGALLVVVSVYSTEMYQQEVNQKLPAGSEHGVCKARYFKEEPTMSKTIFASMPLAVDSRFPNLSPY